MRTRFTILVVVLVGLFATGESAEAQQNKKPSAGELQTEMRRLWEDHITWTRNVILNIMDDLPGTGEAVNRLLQNQEDIGNAIRPYYGAAAGGQLTGLLREHITIAASLLTALKVNNTTALNDANVQWEANADAIATFLSSANPAWQLDEMKAMMREHLSLTAAEAVARKQRDYAADVAAYDQVHRQALAMADMLSGGIVQQFPSRFSGCPVTVRPAETTMSTRAELHQNMPNPFRSETLIRYYIPPSVKLAQLVIYDAMGNVLRRQVVRERGESQFVLRTSGWQKGLYQYSLLADGQLADTKSMMH